MQICRSMPVVITRCLEVGDGIARGVAPTRIPAEWASGLPVGDYLGGARGQGSPSPAPRARSGGVKQLQPVALEVPSS